MQLLAQNGAQVNYQACSTLIRAASDATVYLVFTRVDETILQYPDPGR